MAINTEECSQEVFTHGVSLGFFDMPKAEANAYCERMTEETGNKYDWHYVGGRVHMKMLVSDKKPEGYGAFA